LFLGNKIIRFEIMLSHIIKIIIIVLINEIILPIDDIIFHIMLLSL